ncbi:MAG: branched-chain-amino-acid transaminase [Candidatus Omnitrophica bacterium]|nr:branched-chain-amino-acid transaminase [Candidatus Omnitrophota bacterium]
MSLKIFIDGKFVDKEDAKVSVFDHGVLYGDGVFEGIRSYNRHVFKLDEHIDRLYESAEAIRLNIPVSKKEFISDILETLKLNDLDDAYIRAVVTRGVGDLGLDPRKCAKPTIFIIADKIALYPEELYEDGLPIIISKTRRNHPTTLDPRIKSLNYLNNILAKIDAIDAGVVEALMLTLEGYVVECTGDNIFIIKDGKMYTPPSDIGALEGVTRNVIIELARERNIETDLKVMMSKELFEADECFLTGTAAEIIPVVKIDDKVIGTGKPGKITQEIRKDFKKLTETGGTKY